MKILSAKQIYQADEFTIKKQQITSDSLMERAALGIFNWMHERLQGNPITIHIFCGIGNNGGDGLALARHLKEHDYTIKVHVVNYSEKRSKDFLLNLDRLKARKLWPDFLDEKMHTVSIDPDDIVVDAIFGIGLNRSPDAWVGELIAQINASSAFVLSLDIPSGLFMDRVPEFAERVVAANHVLSFQFPKLPFFLPQTAAFLNQWEVLDIGLDPEFTHHIQEEANFIGKFEVLPFYKPRLKFAHKGSFGHALLIGGSYGKMGAVQLATDACLQAGAGLATAFVPRCGYLPMQIGVPEAMVLTDEQEDVLSAIDFDLQPKAIGIGMGMGTAKVTALAMNKFLDTNQVPLVLDADGLNILARHKNYLKKLPPNSILTPHPKELERLIGVWQDDFEKLDMAKAFAQQHQCILVIKGAHTIVISKNVLHINSTGNPGMATAGSGDALTGVITALLAQNYPPEEAAIFGVYLHGLAGDIVASREGYEAVTASKIISALGLAFVSLFQKENQQGANEQGVD